MARSVRALPGPDRSKGFRQVARGVHVYIGGDADTNFALILTKAKPILIDNDIRVRKRVLDRMRRVTRQAPGLVLNTHHNFDHASDNPHYHRKGAISIGASVVREEMEREERAGIWVSQMLTRPLPVARFVGKLHAEPPMVNFEDLVTIRYGGRVLQMAFIGHCHTKGDTVVWMPEERILFTGDLLDYRTHPVVRLGHLGNWSRAIPLLKKFPARMIVPGHGPIPARPAARVWDEFAGYFRLLRRRTAAALRKEKSPAKAAKLVRMDEYRNWMRSNLVETNALRMARELSREGKKRR